MGSDDVYGGILLSAACLGDLALFTGQRCPMGCNHIAVAPVLVLHVFCCQDNARSRLFGMLERIERRWHANITVQQACGHWHGIALQWIAGLVVAALFQYD